MTLSIRDIATDLGVLNVTVRRWIKEGKIKATLVNRRVGWKIEEEEYKTFLDNHTKYRMMHDKDLYNPNEIRVRETALTNVVAKIIAEKSIVKAEDRCEEYMEGFNRAINDITSAINKEIEKKGPEDTVLAVC